MRLEREGYMKVAEELGYDYKESNLVFKQVEIFEEE